MASKKTIIATLLAVTCVAGYALVEWRLGQWRASVADYEERIRVATAIRQTNLTARYGTPEDANYRIERKYDAAVRDRLIEYHRELEKLLEKKPSLLGLNSRERERKIQVQVALGRFRKGSQERAEESSREYAALSEKAPRRLEDTDTRLKWVPMEVTTDSTPPPTPEPLKVIAPAPTPAPTREQVLSEIERRYGQPPR